MGYTLNQDERSGRWQLFFLDREGQRVRKSTRQTDKRKAVIIADELYRRFGDPTYRAANEATLGTGAAALVEHLTNQGRSKETESFYRKKLAHIYRVMGKDRSLATIDAKRIDAYIADRRIEGAKPYTISKELTALRMLLKELEQENALLRRIVANQRVEIETLQDALALAWVRNNPVIELDSADLEDDE